MHKPFKHQQEVFDRFKDQEYGALFLEPGLGKTKIAIDLAEYKFSQDKIDATLVVTTKGLMLNWADVELPEHRTLPYKCLVWTRDELVITKNLLYYIINIDALITERFPLFMREFIKLYPRYMLVVDESTIAKNPKAKRTIMLNRIAHYANYRFIMTGFPVTNSPLDLFSQCELLKPKILGYKNWWSFKYDHTIVKSLKMGNRSFDKIIGYKNLDQLTLSLRPFSEIRKARDCIDLPPNRYRRMHVDFTKEQAKAYKELKEKALTYIQDHEITAVNAISLINRLLQICSGQLKVDEAYLTIPCNKLSLMQELVEENEKTIIWSAFVNSAVEIMNTLGKDAIWLKSALSIQQRQAIINHFKNSDIKVLVANQASAGHGITLTEASNVIYYANYWSLEHRVQSEFRTTRIGQVKSVLYTDLYIKGTAEEYVLDLLTKYRDVAESIISSKLQDPKTLIKEVLHEI